MTHGAATPEPPHGSESVAFCLRLRAGQAAEYQRRHDALWPDMRQALLDAGLLHYEIYLEPESLLLFAFMIRRRDHTMHLLPGHPAWQRWQAHMSDLLVQDHGVPWRVSLERMFRLEVEAGGDAQQQLGGRAMDAAGGDPLGCAQ
jgi:L-rhamnose mutarotase